MGVVDGFAQDLRYGARVLRRTPVITLFAVVSVAFGIGANTAIFSLLNAVLLHPMPGVGAPHELVDMDTSLPSTILDELGKEPVFTRACGVDTPLLTTEVHGNVQPIGVLAMTGACTDTLSLKAELGRMIQPADDREGSDRVAVLTDSYWRHTLGGRADILGDTIRIDGAAFTIIGVAAPEFQGMLLGFWPGALVPAAQDPSGAHVTAGSRHYSWVRVFARLAPGVSMEQAQARLKISQQRLLEQSVPPDYQGARRRDFVSQQLNLASGATGLDYLLRNRFGRPLTVLLCLCLLVLLISSVNLANLLLARGVRRRREIALRLVMGASRARVARQLGIESLLLVLMGTFLGSIVAYAAVQVLMTQLQATFLNFSLQVSPDLRVLAFAAATTLITGIGFGVFPAWRSSGVDMATALKQASRGIQTGGAGRVLISAQVALTLVLVAGANLFESSLERLRTVPLGLRTDGVVEAQLFPVPNGYNGLSPAGYYRDLLARVESLPGVESASYSNFAVQFSPGYSQLVRFATDQETRGVKAGVSWVSDGFLRTMSIPLTAGQDFQRAGHAGEARTAIVSRSLARLLSPTGNVVGRHIRVGSQPESQDLEITGIAADARLHGARADTLPELYINIWQYSYSAKYGVLLVRTRKLSAGFVELLRGTVRGAGHEFVEYARDLQQQREGSMLEERLLARFSAAFGSLGLLLAATGLYGLLTYHVASRTGEIGIRLALGATQANVRWLVVGEALRLFSAGTVAGLLLTFAAGRFVQSLLYGVRAFEPGPVGVAVIVLAGVAAVASWAPAQRACAVEPLEALRHE